MDAKPQRPRNVRVNDENALPFVPAGKKTLHSRTKSTSALSSLLQNNAVKAATVGKKILGEVNANAKVLKSIKDDSEIGKASPAKLMAEGALKPTVAPLSRPAIRALAPKAVASTYFSNAGSNGPTAQVTLELPKLAPRKSNKILRDAPHEGAAPALPRGSSAATVPQRQEVHKTQSVPLRDEVSTRVIPMFTNSVPEVGPIDSTLVPETAPTVNNTGNQDHVTDQALPTNVASANNVQLPTQSSSVLEEAQCEQYAMAQREEREQEQRIQEQREQEQRDQDEGFTTAHSFGVPAESTGYITTILSPHVTDDVVRELAMAKQITEESRRPDEIEDELWDTSMVAEYGEEIFSYMYGLETRMSPNPRYMDQQTEIQWSMRAVLMDWVIQVHQRFNLLPETLFLTVNFIDRFLTAKVVSLGKLQLVGATAIFVAAKYEEVQCPTIAEVIYMVDGGYTTEELLKAERFMLTMLQFELGWPGPMSFLRRISKADDYDLETRTLAKYFLEVTIMDERFVGFTPSFLAAGAHCLARLMLHKGDWTPMHVHYSQYTYGQLVSLITAMLECCENPKDHHAAVYEKYTDRRYKQASTFVATEIGAGFRVAPFPAPSPTVSETATTPQAVVRAAHVALQPAHHSFLGSILAGA